MFHSFFHRALPAALVLLTTSAAFAQTMTKVPYDVAGLKSADLVPAWNPRPAIHR